MVGDFPESRTSVVGIDNQCSSVDESCPVDQPSEELPSPSQGSDASMRSYRRGSQFRSSVMDVRASNNVDFEEQAQQRSACDRVVYSCCVRVYRNSYWKHCAYFEACTDQV